MQVPTRKPGKYTHDKPDPHITLEKFNELKNKLERLVKVSRPRAAEEVKRLAMMGDFSDNAAYSLAKGRLRGINQRVIELEDQLKKAEIIDYGGKKGQVGLGCTVTVETNGKRRAYLILGSAETNPTQGVISHNSPLGSELMGKRVGDTAQVETKEKIVNYKILKIE